MTREVVIAGVKLTEYDIACAECGSPMVLRASKYGPFYGCLEYPKCLAAHGCHRNGAPLGTPATKEVKEARMRAHAWFDPLWETGAMSRSEAYRWMQTALGLSKDDAHIGSFDLETCNRLIDAVRGHLKTCQGAR